MEIDFNMLRHFTPNFISPNSTSAKFKEVYHHSALEKTFYDERRKRKKKKKTTKKMMMHDDCIIIKILSLDKIAS